MSKCLCEGGEAGIRRGIGGGRGCGEGVVKEDGHQGRGMEGPDWLNENKILLNIINFISYLHDMC